MKSKPDIIVSFGRDGFTGHADHIAVGQVAKSLAHKTGIEFWEFAKPPEDICEDMEWYLKKKRKNGLYKEVASKDSGEVISLKVDPESKMRALRLYKTQFIGINPYNIFPKKIAEHLLGREYFCVIKTDE